MQPILKTCTHCGIAKDVADFNRSSRAADGLQYNCRTCQKARRKKKPCSVDGCAHAHLARGLCTAHWNEWRARASADDLLHRKYQTLAEAMDGRTMETENGCLVWTSNVAGPAPYGVLTFGGERLYAHRVAFEIENGGIPEGTEIDHVCHNTLCVNPRHLRAVTRKQNAENLTGAHSNSHTSVRGVTYDRSRNNYRARIKHNYQEIHLGRFDTLEAAQAAVVEARRRIFTHSDMDQ